jgi:nucleoside-diphosphate-sugar epimerase
VIVEAFGEMNSRVNLVIGSAGSMGRAVVEELASKGQFVRAMVRDTKKAQWGAKDGRVEIFQGSAEKPESLNSAFKGVSVVFNCLNLPYPEWNSLPAIHRQILDAAKRASAKMAFPGNVYIYGHAQSGTVSEDHPRNPCSRKGRLRVQLEDMFMEASRNNDVPTVIVRFPDFYGPNARGISDGIFAAALAGKTARWFGDLDAVHEFILISDAAKAMVMAADRDDAYGQDFNVPGPEPITARNWINLIFKETARQPRMKGTSRLTMRLFGVFNKIAREFAEMQYLTEEPLILDGTKFMKFFGTKYPSTDYDEGIRQTLASMNTRA